MIHFTYQLLYSYFIGVNPAQSDLELSSEILSVFKIKNLKSQS